MLDCGAVYVPQAELCPCLLRQNLFATSPADTGEVRRTSVGDETGHDSELPFRFSQQPDLSRGNHFLLAASAFSAAHAALHASFEQVKLTVKKTPRGVY